MPSRPRLLVRALPLAAGILVACARGNATARTPEQLLRAGQQLYAVHCESCHGGEEGGDPTTYPPRYNANGHTWHHPDCDLKRVIREGSALGGQAMPAFGATLDEDQVDAILAFIKTWWTEEQRGAQERMTEQVCP